MKPFTLFLVISLAFSLIKIPDYQLPVKVVYSCGDDIERVEFDDIPECEGYEQWVMKSGFLDGTYYEATIEFSDGVRGRLFKGSSSGRYFVEDSSGNNYYYISLKTAIRALYLYKKHGCLSSKYRL
jgi:hypothetical protein